MDSGISPTVRAAYRINFTTHRARNDVSIAIICLCFLLEPNGLGRSIPATLEAIACGVLVGRWMRSMLTPANGTVSLKTLCRATTVVIAVCRPVSVESIQEWRLRFSLMPCSCQLAASSDISDCCKARTSSGFSYGVGMIPPASSFLATGAGILNSMLNGGGIACCQATGGESLLVHQWPARAKDCPPPYKMVR